MDSLLSSSSSSSSTTQSTSSVDGIEPPSTGSYLSSSSSSSSSSISSTQSFSSTSQSSISPPLPPPLAFPPPQPTQGRAIGKKRFYKESECRYGPWQIIYDLPSSITSSPSPKVINIELKRGSGSTLQFFPRLIPPSSQLSTTLKSTMAECRLYRQYTFGAYEEPRVHVMLSDYHDLDRGYVYHGVKMKTLSLSVIPEVQTLSYEYAKLFQLPDNKWSIGVDLVCYRDGRDSIGYHADDTQDETVVLCVVVESEGSRPVCIRPNKRVKQLSEGDEEVELFVEEGDGYVLDAGCQAGYEHALPKRKDMKSRRMVAIFRQGKEVVVGKDSGKALDVDEYLRLGLVGDGGVGVQDKIELEVVEKANVVSPDKEKEKEQEQEQEAELEREQEEDMVMEISTSQQAAKSPPPPNLPTLPNPTLVPKKVHNTTNWGHPSSFSSISLLPQTITEGSVASRADIYRSKSHNSDQKGVSGNIADGCDAVVVARQNTTLREGDGFEWLRYTSARFQGGGALWRSKILNKPIRVFRSDTLGEPFAPPIHLRGSKDETASSNLKKTPLYRYDGLYTIAKMWNCEGELTELEPVTDGIRCSNPQHTFLLKRCPTEEKHACATEDEGGEGGEGLKDVGVGDDSKGICEDSSALINADSIIAESSNNLLLSTAITAIEGTVDALSSTDEEIFPIEIDIDTTVDPDPPPHPPQVQAISSTSDLAKKSQQKQVYFNERSTTEMWQLIEQTYGRTTPNARPIGREIIDMYPIAGAVRGTNMNTKTESSGFRGWKSSSLQVRDVLDDLINVVEYRSSGVPSAQHVIVYSEEWIEAKKLQWQGHRSEVRLGFTQEEGNGKICTTVLRCEVSSVLDSLIDRVAAPTEKEIVSVECVSDDQVSDDVNDVLYSIICCLEDDDMSHMDRLQELYPFSRQRGLNTNSITDSEKAYITSISSRFEYMSTTPYRQRNFSSTSTIKRKNYKVNMGGKSTSYESSVTKPTGAHGRGVDWDIIDVDSRGRSLDRTLNSTSFAEFVIPGSTVGVRSFADSAKHHRIYLPLIGSNSSGFKIAVFPHSSKQGKWVDYFNTLTEYKRFVGGEVNYEGLWRVIGVEGLFVEGEQPMSSSSRSSVVGAGKGLGATKEDESIDKSSSFASVVGSRKRKATVVYEAEEVSTAVTVKPEKKKKRKDEPVKEAPVFKHSEIDAYYEKVTENQDDSYWKKFTTPASTQSFVDFVFPKVGEKFVLLSGTRTNVVVQKIEKRNGIIHVQLTDWSVKVFTAMEWDTVERVPFVTKNERAPLVAQKRALAAAKVDIRESAAAKVTKRAPAAAKVTKRAPAAAKVVNRTPATAKVDVRERAQNSFGRKRKQVVK